MSRKLTPQSTLANLKREAKRWLRALREHDPAARARLTAAHPGAADPPPLRDVQHALAREHGFDGWRALTAAVARLEAAGAGSGEAGVQALLAAAERGDADAVISLLDQTPGLVNEMAVLPGHTGRRSALHFATNSGKREVLEALLDRGADPNLRDEGDNATPLHFVAEKGRLDLVRLLIARGADPIGAGDWHELEAIGWAVAFPRVFHPDVAEYLLAHGGRHNLFSAVAMGAIDAIRECVAGSPDALNRPMDAVSHRRRALHLAVVKRQPAALLTLLELGADPESLDAAGLTPLDQAALGGEREMVETLLAHGAKVRLPAAVILHRADDLAALGREEPDALRPGGRWARLIVRAAESAPGPVIEALIQAGASVHQRDDHRTAVDGTHGYTPLHAAAFNGNDAAIRVLLRHGANPADREDRYWGTPAGWAEYAGHESSRDLILAGPIDVFDAISFGRLDRLGELARDPEIRERPFGQYVTGDRKPRLGLDPAWTPLAYAVAHGNAEAARRLIDLGARLDATDSGGRTPLDLARAASRPELVSLLESASRRSPARRAAADDFDARVTRFVRLACLDWRVGGSARAFRAHDARRLLEREPAIGSASVFAAIAAGRVDEVARRLAERPSLALEPGGPRGWAPLLYLCSARLDLEPAEAGAVTLARLLLDHGADPNAFYLGGNADIHYTALACVLGRGEEQAAMHPRVRELTALLLERGADPHDPQVLYNVFADHASRRWLTDDIVWLLELLHAASIRRGRGADWRDPTWPMFDLRGAPSLGADDRPLHHGAHFLLDAAVDRNLLGMAEWLLSHGAGPDTRWQPRPSAEPAPTLYQQAVAAGRVEMAALLARHGARVTTPAADERRAFLEACFALDRRRAEAAIAERPELLRDPRALVAAVGRDAVPVVELLLDLGVSPDVEDPQDHSRALHAAAYAGSVRSAELLIRRGAAVDARETTHDAIPLGIAAWGQQPAMIELLGRYSRDVWELTYTGRVERLRQVLAEEPRLARAAGPERGTPLHWLPDDAGQALEAARLLLEAGADPNAVDARGETAADLAERRGLDQVARLLRGG